VVAAGSRTVPHGADLKRERREPLPRARLPMTHPKRHHLEVHPGKCHVRSIASVDAVKCSADGGTS
jgi:hypothetical protein